MNQSTQTTAVCQGKVALIPWGLTKDLGKVDDAIVSRVIDNLEHRKFHIELMPSNLRRSHGEWIEADMIQEIETLRSMSVKKVVLFVARSGEHMQEFMGALTIAGIEIFLVGIEGYKLTPVPCTRKHVQDKKAANGKPSSKWNRGIPTKLAAMSGKWIELRPGILKWQEPRWSHDELVATEFPFGSVIMWSIDDYMQKMPNGKKVWAIERPIPAKEIMEKIIHEANQTEWNNLGLLNRRYFTMLEKHSQSPTAAVQYESLVPPDDIEYPHEFNLVGFKFSEVPARYFDYLVGQDWIYGEFAQRVRAWHKYLCESGQLDQYEDKEMLSDLKSDSTGYWNAKDQYIYTGCQGGKSIKEIPTWLVPRDRFGHPLKDRVKENQQIRDRYAAGLEKALYHDGEDQPPENWTFTTPWAFESWSDGRDEKHEDEIEERNLIEGIHYRLLDEEEEFVRKATDDAKWIYNADVHVEQAIEKAKQRAITAGQKARASGNEEAIFEAKRRYKNACNEWPEQRQRAEKKAEAHAWYLAVELLDQINRVKERAASKEVDVWQLFRELEKVSLQLTPRLREWLDKKRGNAETTMWQLLIAEGRACKEELKKEAESMRTDPSTTQLAEVLRENPKLIYILLKIDYGMLIKVLRENRDIGVPEDLIQVARQYHKEQVKRFPEIWTKKGTRRVHPIHERKNHVAKLYQPEESAV